MNAGEGLRQAWDTIRHNKLQTFLTVLGIVIGVSAVVTVMASGSMARSTIMSGIERISATLIWINPNTEIYGEREPRYLRPEDIRAMTQLVDGVVFSPLLRETVSVSCAGVSEDQIVYAVKPAYQEIWNHRLRAGRFIEEEDMRLQRKVAVLGDETARIFFGGKENALGESIRIDESTYTVVGIVARRSHAFVHDGSDDSTIYVPYSTFASTLDWEQFGGPKVFLHIIQVNDKKNLGHVIGTFQRYLLSRYGRLRGQPRFIINTAQQNIATFNKVFSVITLLVSLLAGISVLVSGIGVMNIMLVTVSERTTEIGVRKSVGATSADILSQFLVEALIICLAGGGIGIALGLGVSSLVAAAQKWRYFVPFQAVLIGVGISSVVGLFFGAYPAYRAARTDPVVALYKE